VETVVFSGFGSQTISVAIGAIGLVFQLLMATSAAAGSMLTCQQGTTLATGDPDPTIFADEASKGVRAFWCERYDTDGMTTRTGPYWEIYSNGRPRTQAIYVNSQLSGPVTIRDEDGGVFARGFLKQSEWSGAFEIFHPNGATWFEASFESGRLEGEIRTHFPDGAIESESRYQAGREDGLARSFYPTAAGGRLKSEAHVEADQIVGEHRLLNRNGALVRSIDWDLGPAAWRKIRANPAARDPGTPFQETSGRIPDLRD
jgi:hypothetical protein